MTGYAVIILPLALIGWWFALRRLGWRHAGLGALAVFGAAVFLGSELLGLGSLIAPQPLLLWWVLVVLSAAMCGLRLARGAPEPTPQAAPRGAVFALACVAGMLATAGIVGFTALLSPPNSADAMSYHLPRVVYWAQARNVSFFPTSYYGQLSFPPLAEYFMLHTWVLSGGDRFANLVQFSGLLGSVVGVSLIAREMGLSSRGQAFAALFAATLPIGILQASGAKNDYLLALWLVCAGYFGLRAIRRGGVADAMFLGLCSGLALATKGTAYLFLPPILIAFFLAVLRSRSLGARQKLALAGWIAGGVLLINAPHWLRNHRMSGSLLGFDSAHGDGVFRWGNERFGWRPAVSNALRLTSEQLGARSPAWNQGLFDAVVGIHAAFGMDPYDPATTWPRTRFEPPRNTNHEANAPNRWHLALLWLAQGPAIWLALRRGDARWAAYSAVLLSGFLAFCFYLKWQPFMARLMLPLLALAAPMAGFLLEQVRFRAVQWLLCLFLLNNARPYLFENWTRPLTGPRSLLRTSREMNYFADLGPWDNLGSYLETVEQTARSGCTEVGIDISRNEIEYPFQALLRRQVPSVRFQHTGVHNASARYADPRAPEPCAVLCMDCAGREEKIVAYSALGAPMASGHFLLFLRPPR